MNAIPFVIIFIAVISLSWTSLMQTTISSNRSCQGYLSHMTALNNARSKIEKGFFSKAKKNSKKQSTPTERTGKTYSSPRIATKKESSKLFLSQTAEKHSIEAFERLLDILYSDAPFYHEKLAGKISEQLFPLISEEFELTQLRFTDEKISEAWYCMLKGSNSLPLSQFISLQSNENLIYSRYASFPVLSALFGKGVAEDILEKEEEKYFSEPDKQSLLSEEEITQILSHHNLSALKHYLNFSSSPQVPLVIEGKDNDISLEIRFQTKPTDQKDSDDLDDELKT